LNLKKILFIHKMACIQYPRKERGGVSLPSYEQPTIYREPPKEIFTKKKERIEEGDITYNIRNDPSRYNDAITNWQKGKNMMVEVDYQNRAPQTTTMNFGSASNPYKVNKSFRPPEFGLLDLQPLSRQQRPYTAAQTNIGSQITRIDSSEIRMDKSEISFSIGDNTTMHTALTNPSNEMGVYHDNHDRTDMIHEDKSWIELLSSLKGIESVELQKLFSYQQTPYGIVLSPIHFQVDSTTSGPADFEAQRNLSNLISHLQEQLQYEQHSNQSGPLQYESQRTLANQDVYIRSDGLLSYIGTNQSGPYQYESNHTIDTNGYISEPLRVATGTNHSALSNVTSVQNQHGSMDSFINDNIQFGLETNQSGMKQYDSQRNLSNLLSHLQQQLQIGIGVNQKGQISVESQRELSDVLNYLKDQLYISAQTSESSTVKDVESQRNLSNLISHLQDYLQVGIGSNIHSNMKYSSSYEHQDQMKDILLKNMTSAVHIVIQKSGSNDEYQVKGNIQDKIGIVVDSTKGGSLQLMGEHGQPIHLKEYTWKFVKSAMGADKFIIQLPNTSEIQLERKGELYAVYSNPSQQTVASIQPEEVNLKRMPTNITVITNVELQGNNERANESQFQRVEKQTHYTDFMVQSNEPSLQRAEHTLDSIRSIQSSKKQNIQQTILRQSEGRF
jgi:hypothetical protein